MSSSVPDQFNPVAIIQARMDSTRLPGKVMLPIEGRPMLWHIVERLRRSKALKKIVIATTTEDKDSAIEGFCRENRVDCYHGSTDDVLDRYYKAAREHDADPVVRITADCPLIDPGITDKVVSEYLKNRTVFRFASNIIERTYPRGLDVEVISFSALERCRETAKSPHQKEHVTPYIYEHRDEFDIVSVEQKEDLSHLRWTVDEYADLSFVKEIYKRLYADGRIFSMDDVLGELKRHPSLSKINSGVMQKAVRP